VDRKQLNSLPDWGNCLKPAEKAELGPVRAAQCGKDQPGMRVMFFTWLVLIATGLVFYTVIGLAHN
jgi:hypothetical protein